MRPVFARHCAACHTASALGGLRVDSREALLHGGQSGPALVPGEPGRSLLLQVVEQTHERLKMPPSGKIPAADVAALREWIQQGAPWPAKAPTQAAKATAGPTPEQRAFWAFQPVRPAPVPAVREGRWARNELDRFLLAKMEAEGLTPAPAASPRALLRRVTFDLTGLPPTPEEMNAFLADRSPQAWEKVVDRLLASPHYGERWARHWLDLARYSDGSQGARVDTPYPNAFRYRDWVVESFNRDLPYNKFIEAQLAADLLPEGERKELLPGLGFQTLGESNEDRVDVTTRVFLGMTVGCAQCHDHKFDPIPTKDYYALLGVFKSSVVEEHPLVAADVVAARKAAQKRSEAKKEELKLYLEQQVIQIADMLASRTEEYLIAAWNDAPAPEGLDAETLARWKKYLARTDKEHNAFAAWDALRKRGNATPEEVRALAHELQESVHAVIAEKKALDDRNYVKLGGLEGMKDTNRVISTLVDALPIERYYFWRDMASKPYKVEDIVFGGGVYYYGPKEFDRFFTPAAKQYLAQLRKEDKALEAAIPAAYPFWHVLQDGPKPANCKIAVRGDVNNPGEEAPRAFLTILSPGTPQPFTQGSGRLELARAIASPENPLTARVFVNRVWKYHFGEGLVRSTSNFGQLGDRPTHPELLDWLAARFVASGWSVKRLHRDILLSAAYRMSSEETPASRAKDPANLLLSHANTRERMDAEALRDSILAVAGQLDLTVAGPSAPLTDAFRRRTLYGTVSRSVPDRTMAIFDFPDPNSTSEQRIVTVGPMQRLYFLNSSFVQAQAKALSERLAKEAPSDAARIDRAYQLLFGRPPTKAEMQLGLGYLKSGAAAWPRYAQVLLGTAEFSAIQ